MKRILALGLVILLSGCAQIPVTRTYSLAYSDGKQSISAGVTLQGYKK